MNTLQIKAHCFQQLSNLTASNGIWSQYHSFGSQLNKSSQPCLHPGYPWRFESTAHSSGAKCETQSPTPILVNLQLCSFTWPYPLLMFVKHVGFYKNIYFLSFVIIFFTTFRFLDFGAKFYTNRLIAGLGPLSHRVG